MDVSKIKALLLAVEKKSFSKAAEELSYTPSAFSHIVDSIEEELGIKILNRTFNGVELNENGKLLLDKLTALITAEKELLASAKNLNVKNERLRIGAYSSIAQHILPEIINKFKQENPFIKVSIKVDNELKGLLDNYSVDIIFTENKYKDKGYVKIMTDPFVVVAPKNVLVGKKTVQAEELYNYTCIIHRETIFKNYFNVNKFKEIIYFDSIEESAIVSMVENNIGIAVLPSLMLKNKPKNVHIVKLEPSITRTIGFVYNRKSNSDTIKKFVKFIKKSFPQNTL